MLLCTKQDNKTKEEFIFQYEHAPLYADRSEALAQIGSDYSAGTPGARIMENALADKFWSLRQTAIRNIGVLAKADPEHIKSKLLALATQDDRSQVRVAALKALAKYYTDADLSVYQAALHDSSYLVVRSAFKIICDQDESKGFEIAKNLEAENDPDITVAVASFYAQKGKEENNDFLLSVLTKAKGYDRYTLISAYGTFLTGANDQHVLKAGIDKLALLGRTAGSRYVRYAAVGALGDVMNEFESRITKAARQLDELKNGHASVNETTIEESKLQKLKMQRDELNETIAAIKKNEKDKRLIKAYNNN